MRTYQFEFENNNNSVIYLNIKIYEIILFLNHRMHICIMCFGDSWPRVSGGAGGDRGGRPTMWHVEEGGRGVHRVRESEWRWQRRVNINKDYTSLPLSLTFTYSAHSSATFLHAPHCRSVSLDTSVIHAYSPISGHQNTQCICKLRDFKNKLAS